MLPDGFIRETIKKRMRDLFERDFVERRRDHQKKGLPWIKRNGALVYWPTAAGILENGTR